MVLIERAWPPAETLIRDHPQVATPTRLVIYWVDSLSDRDLGPKSPMTHLVKRLPQSLHGHVTACADATSVPCFEAMTTGWDRASLATLARNFGGDAGAGPSGVLGVLRTRGHKLGFIGDPFVRGATGAFDWVRLVRTPGPEATIEAGLTALDAQALDLVVIHLVQADAVAHRVGDGRRYRRMLKRIDAAIATGMERLRPSDHVVVLGDHGHTPDGRHAPGLAVPTYAVYSGPRFAARPARRYMTMTDHAGLWAALFGVQYGDVPWVARYFAGTPLPKQIRHPMPAGSNRPFPPWALAVLSGLSLLAVETRRGRPRLVALGALALAFAGGLAYLQLRPVLQGRFSDLQNVAMGLTTGLLGAALLRLLHPPTRALGPDALPTALVAGAALLALPTVYPFGGASAALLGLVLAAAVLAGRARTAARWDRSALLWALFAVALALSFRRVDMGGFQVFRFHAWRALFGLLPATIVLGALWAALTLALAWRPGVERRRLVAGALVGASLYALLPILPPWVWLLPCVAALPLLLLGLRAPRFDPLWLALLPPALGFFFESDAARLAPMLGVVLLAFAFARAAAAASPALRGLGLFVCLWLCAWASFGARAHGVRFQYFFAWVAEGSAVEDSWTLNGLLTTAKYLLPPLLAVVVTARAGGGALVESLWAAAALGRARVGVVLAFIAGVLWIGHAGNNLLGDLVQELALCGFLALAIALAAWASPARPPRKDLPTGYFLHTDDAPRPRRSSPGDETAPGTRLADPHPERTRRHRAQGLGPRQEIQRCSARGTEGSPSSS